MTDPKNALPTYSFHRVTDIAPANVRDMGVSALALDIDNTLTKDGAFHLSHAVKSWALAMKAAGIRLVIVTNTYHFRARIIAKKLGVPFVAQAHKPSAWGLRRAAEKLRLEVGDLAMVGDRLFTDMRCANAAGAVGVKLDPIAPEILFPLYNRRQRRAERRYLEKYKI